MPSLPKTRVGADDRTKTSPTCAFALVRTPARSSRFRPTACLNLGIYRTKLGDIRMAEKLPTLKNRNICRLSLRYGQYHLSVPYDEKLAPARENQARVVALDPGVRSFLTWYCADSVGKIGEGAFFRIQRLCERTGRAAEPCGEVTIKEA